MQCYRKFKTPYKTECFDGGREYSFQTPSECPMCHHGIEPIVIEGYSESEDNLSVAMVCNSCNNMFIARYKETGMKDYGGYQETEIINCEPSYAVKKTFDPKLEKLSKKFCLTWNQATEAETLQLDEISGIAYRKALEYLVKDYCIHLHPDKKDKIIKTWLSDCIKTYLTDYKPIADISTVAVWMGNDESHYYKTSGKDNIDKLKRYIVIMVRYVEMSLTYQEASETIHKK